MPVLWVFIFIVAGVSVVSGQADGGFPVPGDQIFQVLVRCIGPSQNNDRSFLYAAECLNVCSEAPETNGG